MKPPLFSCLTSRVANNGSLYGRFLFGPLPIDLSLTVATILRRSLLHSQATFTIVSAEIEGATHEYASLPGIQESVLEILLNLGEIVLTSTQRNFISPNFRTGAGFTTQDVTPEFSFAFIRISGPGTVTAKNINWPKGIFCVKPNSIIATLSSNETLTMRLKIACSLNRNRQSFYKIETKPEKFTNPTTHLDSSSFNSDSLTRSSTTLPDFDRKLGSPTFPDSLENKRNKKNEKELFSNNKNPFDFFKFQGSVSTMSSVSSFSNESFLSTSGSFDLLKIKKKVSVNRVLEKAQTKTSNKLLTAQTQALAHTVLANRRGLEDSYSIRKQKSISLSFSSILTKQDIFTKNNSQTKDNAHPYENEKDEQNTITFRVFPDLFKDFADLSFQKTENVQTLSPSFKRQDVEPELNSLNKIKSIQEKDLIDTNTKRVQFSSQKKQTEKYELAVSSSSYPVEKVNFLIERDDELAGYRHRIILEVWTNGSISPRQAIFDSLGSIIKLIFNFREPLRNSFNNDFFSETFVD